LGRRNRSGILGKKDRLSLSSRDPSNEKNSKELTGIKKGKKNELGDRRGRRKKHPLDEETGETCEKFTSLIGKKKQVEARKR